MADATLTPPEPEHGSTRRGFLGHMAGAVTAGVVIDAGMSEAASAKERADFHYREFAKAMGELTEGLDGWNLYAGEHKGFKHLNPVSYRNVQGIRFALDRERSWPMIIERHSPLKI